MNTNIANIVVEITDNKQSSFQILWNKIEKAEIRNKKAEDKVSALYEQYESILLPHEKELANTHCNLIEQLISFVPSEKLSKNQRDLLCAEIEDNFEEVHQKSSIYDSERISKLLEIFDKLNIKFFPEERKEFVEDEYEKMMSYFRMFAGNDLELPDDEIKEAIVSGDMSKLESLLKKVQDDLLKKRHEEKEDWDDHEFNYYEREEDDTSKVKEVFKASQLNKMYKKIANVIHPDKELDPSKIEEKKVLMQQLTEAKNNSDVFTLIKMYQTHVPDGEYFLDDDSLKHIEHLFQMNIYKLNQEHRDIFNSQGMKSNIWKTFSSTSKKKTLDKLNDGIDMVKEATRELEQKINNADSLPKIKKRLKKSGILTLCKNPSMLV